MTLTPTPDSSVEEYTERLNNIRRKEPLREQCNALHLSVPRTANLERLRAELILHWFPTHSTIGTCRAPNTPCVQATQATDPDGDYIDTDDSSEETLVAQFAIDGAAADEILGFDEDNELVDDEEEELEDNVGDVSFEEFVVLTRVDEAKRSEANRRAGGVKTQSACEKDWVLFCHKALRRREIQDTIIDCHHLILYIRHSAGRAKRTRKGIDIPGTLLGASQLKKLYFGALRIRKLQEAKDSTLETRRPVKSVHVWDCIKGRMNEALNRVRNGLVPGEDAPDIIANTFLAGVTDLQMEKVGEGFLMHRELRSIVNGHLAWTAQNASGNRGDDFRALKLAELQPYVFLHPNKETAVECVLGLQGEEKAAANRGMRTKVNPVYTVFIAHKEPTMCPLGAFAFYHHFIHDVKNIGEKLDIDWTLNKSWRQVRVLHGKSSPRTPYHEGSLYNLYVKAFEKAGFVSKIKAHLPRHLLGYNQEKMGVDATHTARMGWTRGQTYFDTYAPAIPKEAVLGAHGFKTHEVYDPTWRRVHVPEPFLQLVCPIAEGIHARIVGKDNLSGAANYWSMCAAAIYQKYPDSGLFRLPALANPEVQHWMKTEYLSSLTLLKANEGSTVDLERIQNSLLRLSLEEMRSLLASQSAELRELRILIQRRTEVLSPAKGFSNHTYQKSLDLAPIPQPLFRLEATSPTIQDQTDNSAADNTGVYFVDSPITLPGSPLRADCPQPPGSPLRAFVNASPKRSSVPRAKTQVDLVLPPSEAFSRPGGPQLIWPLVMGQQSVTWDYVFKLIKRPELLWDAWGPSKTLNRYTLDEQWNCYNLGEPVFDNQGVQTGMKPPLRQIELYFQASWRTTTTARKSWQRFREIPEYIDCESTSRGVSPQVLIEELDILAQVEGRAKLGLAALTDELIRRRLDKAKATAVQGIQPEVVSTTHDPVSHTVSSTVSETQGKRKKRQAPIAPRKRVKRVREM